MSFAIFRILLDTYSIISWPWQISWLQQVLWEILNFSVIVAVCTLCRPSGRVKCFFYIKGMVFVYKYYYIFFML